MQVFVPYPEPIKVAQCLDAKRLNKQVIECRQILDAIDGKGNGWFHHPVTAMYKPYREWLSYYANCLDCFHKGLYEYARAWNKSANKIRPPFLTEGFCTQHKRRLFAKNHERYKQFAEYGASDENWYWDNETNQIIKYINGKRNE